MVDKAHAGMVEVQSRDVIADPVATDHCGLVVRATLRK